MKGKTKTKILSVLLLTLLYAPPIYAATAMNPTVWVKAMLDQVMAVQTNPDLQGAQSREMRKKAIKKIIAENFDFERMAKKSLGSYAQKLTAEQLQTFEKLFAQLFQDSYTRLVLDFLKKEQIEYRRETISGNQATVTTTIVRINDTIPVKYFLVKNRKGWLIEDVEVDDVSIVKNYRRAFARVIKTHSFDALLQRMRTQLKTVN